MGYVHKSQRNPPAPPAVPVSPPAISTEVSDAAWVEALSHRQLILAGVPSCSCGMTFDSHTTFVAEHARHLADTVAARVLVLVLAAVQASGSADDGAAGVIHSMLSRPLLQGAS